MSQSNGHTAAASNPEHRYRAIHGITLELSGCASLDELFHMVVDIGRDRLGLDRVGILRYDPRNDLVCGTWGTDAHGNVVNETGHVKPAGHEKDLIAHSLQDRDYVAVWPEHELEAWGEQIGTGWNAMLVLWNGAIPFGWLAADNLIHHRPLEPIQKELLIHLGRIVSNMIMKLHYEQSMNAEVVRQTADLVHSQSKLREINNSLAAQNELKERLFTILAHDLRGPVGTLLRLFNLICDNPATYSDQELRSMMPELRRSVDSTYNLLENLLGWVKGQMQEITAQCALIPAGHLIGTVCSWLEAHAKSKHIAIEKEIPRDLEIHSDERIIEIILRNILSNAIKFSPSDTTITIRAQARPAESGVAISISDQGLGMDSDQITRLFSMDHSRRTSGTAGESGSGLGMMFSMDLARRIGGTIVVESQSGQGSTFTLILPDHIEGDIPAP